MSARSPFEASGPLQRVARLELEKIERARARLEERLAATDQERAKLRGQLARLQERVHVLEQIVAPDKPPTTDLPAEVVLSGRRLRQEAVRILLGSVGANQPTHYRDWHDLVASEGFVVLGKKPVATFLTAIGRSPVIRRGDDPGTYYVDPSVARDLESRLAEVDAELADLKAVLAREPNPTSVLREHRVKLRAEQRRLRGQLDETEAVLGPHAEVAHISVKRSVA